jgi:hypothetical protein
VGLLQVSTNELAAVNVVHGDCVNGPRAATSDSAKFQGQPAPFRSHTSSPQGQALTAGQISHSASAPLQNATPV